ncbi:hypothetical protein AJ79_08441 [Helicocarpus griseus UAMH5409]|uniref:Uncharacterized protein n=1 Tax=Helicocarpus griseus UAMH5409 TaxID=1447875 RepID=A0A2B7WT86_9EURO|nr:hypothetical protein AJ79_08441 [Helicocarpus griseus UAMH5409]
MASPKASLEPSEISRSTISYLLSLYPQTVSEVYRSKLLTKSSGKKGSKAAPKVSATNEKNDKYIEKEVKAFLKLDKLRYETLPAVLKERAGTATATNSVGEGKKELDAESSGKKRKVSDKTSKKEELAGAYLEKDEVVNLMDWKLKHGSQRPTLLGLIRSNNAPIVQSTTSTAFSQLQAFLSPSEEVRDTFPVSPLETLTKALRGVGPATASLFLSLASGHDSSDELSAAALDADANEPPFFSDELFEWLCLHKLPHKGDAPATSDQKEKSKIKYNMREYRQLWEAMRELRERVNEISDQGGVEGDRKVFSVLDIERVAYVIGHLEVSGYKDGTEIGGGGEGVDSAAQDAKVETADGGKRKRKRG